MKNRKPLLRRILQDEFDLRGKCVPPINNGSDNDDAHDDDDDYDEDEDEDEDELEFVTHCTIEQLGIFIISLLNEEDSYNNRNGIR